MSAGTQYIEVMQGDTDTRNFTLEDQNGVINLTKFERILFVIDDHNGHYYEIVCVEQSRTRTPFVSKEKGGIAVPFNHTNIGNDGSYDGQFVLSNYEGTVTYPLGKPIILNVIAKVIH
jgi:hypothetical protein